MKHLGLQNTCLTNKILYNTEYTAKNLLTKQCLVRSHTERCGERLRLALQLYRFIKKDVYTFKQLFYKNY
jgi:hypothetical protein